MVRGTGLVGRAVARFEQQREIGQRDAASGENGNYRNHHNDAPSGGNTYQSYIPQPLRNHETKSQSRHEVMTSPEVMTSEQHRELLELREAEAALRAELRELREHNELLEFRLLEKSACGDESDDVSDSGVSEELRELDPQHRMEMETQHRDRIEMDPQHRDRIERLLSLSEPVLVSHKLSEEGLLSPLSMHESGIFDTLIIETESRSTQTEIEEENTPDLRCEIQKLLRFREQVCGNEKNIELNVLLQKLNDTSHGECERLNAALRCHEGRIKELSAKCERLGRENRRLDEANCGDGECERLAAKLRQQEYRLKELSERCERLQTENRRLDEERCEYEEAENDARLISQRLQTQVSWLSEQNSAVRSELRHNAGERGALRREARHWEGKAQQLEERNFELEELNVDTRHRLSCLEDAVPAILAFGVVLSARSRRRRRVAALPAPEESGGTVETEGKKTVTCAVQTDEDAEVAELRAKVQAYGETLRLADQLWSQAEREYQERLLGAEATLARLRERVGQLEEHVGRVRAVCSDDKVGVLEARLAALHKSERRLQQHVHELEASEMSLKEELAQSGSAAASRERRLQQDVARLREEASEARAAALDLQRHEVAWQNQATAARREGEALRGELREKQEALLEAQQALAQEEARGRTQRTRSALQLAEAECTSSELREEVETLEASLARVRGQLEAQRQAGERAILRLNLQLSDRERELAETRRELEFAGHHEAGVAALAQRAALAAHAVQECSRCRDVVRTEMCEISSQLRALGAIISGDVTSTRCHLQGSPGSTDDDEEELHPPVAPQHTVTSTGVKVIAGSRVRAVQRALLQASKPALSVRAVSELVAR